MAFPASNMAPSAPSAPWEVGPQSVYDCSAAAQALWGLEYCETPEAPQCPMQGELRASELRKWGRQREDSMRRPPYWCMDQLLSGSGFFPPRLLTDDWFTSEELCQIERLERLLAPTARAQPLARDVMALKIYDVDVRIIVDDSGSMNSSMFGYAPTGSGGWTRNDIQRVFGSRAFQPDNAYVFESSHLSPNCSRWTFAHDALRQWEEVFNALEMQPQYYLLNGHRRGGIFGGVSGSSYKNCAEIFSRGPCGGTPMGQTLVRVLQDVKSSDPFGKQTHLILILTDGEANDKDLFNQTLDQIQDELYGDVQVCLLGLSLEPADIAWFEDEECDDTRIRTIEPWEVEQQQMLWRQVIGNPQDYNFAMHTMRALVTNLFPADYDCEAPLQTLRHRLYITLHAMDRRVTGRRDAEYSVTSASLDRGSATSLDRGCGCLSGLQALGSEGPRRARAMQEVEIEGQLDDQRLADLVASARPRGLTAGDCGRPSRLSMPWNSLKEVQNAIGCLQPAEFNSRDLQYSNLYQNDKACRQALRHLFLAAGLEPLQ